MDTWMVQPSVYVSRSVYHRSALFKGNMAKKLIRMSENLAEYVEKMVDRDTALKAEPFILAFSQFNQVVDACFGSDLDPDYTTLIQDFMRTYRNLQISIPLKVTIYNLMFLRENLY